MSFRRLVGTTTLALVLVSMTTNILMLTGPLFMLQVYDRVLTSRSIPTLVVLLGLVAGVYAFYAALDILRARIASRLAAALERSIGNRLFALSIKLRIASPIATNVDPVKDGDTVRSFLASPAPLALLDLPWIPIYLSVLFIVHPLLGWLSTAGGVVATTLMLTSEFLLRRPAVSIATLSARRSRALEDAQIGGELIIATGMFPSLQSRWSELGDQLLSAQGSAGDIGSMISSISKAFRLLLQSLVLALGAYLVISGEMTGGLMMAASVMTSKALAPIEQTVAQWKSVVSARLAYRRLRKYLSVAEPKRELRAPAPSHDLTVRSASTGPSGVARPLVTGINVQLRAGDGLGILGPSGAGKTSVARALLGIWPLLSGEVRLDGVLLDHYDIDQRVKMVGYLPQRVDLFEGTVARNIARFADPIDGDAVMKAARLADVHALISALPNGYDTEIGPQGGLLSAGQRQRIGLARALYGDPFLCVFDEPNANLDADGEVALTGAIRSVRSRGGVVIVIAHRPSAIAAVDLLLFVRDGRQIAFGDKEDVLRQIRGDNVRELKAAAQ